MFSSYFLLLFFSNRLVFGRFLQYYWYSYFFLMSLTFMLLYFLFPYPQCLCCFYLIGYLDNCVFSFHTVCCTLQFRSQPSFNCCNFYSFALEVFSVCFLVPSTSFSYFFLFSVSSILLNFSHVLFLCPFCSHFLDCFSFYFRFYDTCNVYVYKYCVMFWMCSSFFPPLIFSSACSKIHFLVYCITLYCVKALFICKDIVYYWPFLFCTLWSISLYIWFFTLSFTIPCFLLVSCLSLFGTVFLFPCVLFFALKSRRNEICCLSPFLTITCLLMP